MWAAVGRACGLAKHSPLDDSTSNDITMANHHTNSFRISLFLGTECLYYRISGTLCPLVELPPECSLYDSEEEHYAELIAIEQ
jgi:hypothetical protein